MKLSKNGLNILATVNAVIFFTFWIVSIFLSGFFFTLSTRWYLFFMLFSSLSVFYRHVEIAAVFQLVGCFQQGIVFFMQMGIAMAFNLPKTKFWETLVNIPFFALEFFSFLGFCVVAVGLLIFEYRRYNAKKHQNITS